MIFFLAHYFCSPLFNRERLRAKATVKLVVSATIFVFSLYQTLSISSPLLKPDDVNFLRPLYVYLVAETFLDCLCFALLLGCTSYDLPEGEAPKRGKAHHF